MLLFTFDRGVDAQEIVKQLNNSTIQAAGMTFDLQAEVNGIFRTSLVPNDPLYSLPPPGQWAHQITHAEQGWDVNTGNSNIKIAILDTGVATIIRTYPRIFIFLPVQTVILICQY